MILNPQKRETINGLSLYSYILPINTVASPKEIQVYLLTEPITTRYTSCSEFLTRRAALQEFEAFDYFVDNIAAWKILEAGEIIRLAIIGEGGKRKALKLIPYLLDKYNLTLENIVLTFEDKNFIKKLINSQEDFIR